MQHTVLTVVAEVQPASEDLLRRHVLALRRREKGDHGRTPYDRLGGSLPSLHFLSITVCPDDRFDSVLVVEANFDGAPGPFWAQLEASIGADLREMLRCCKQPRDRRGALFTAVTRSGSRAPLAPLLEALAVAPLVSHVGNRGLDRRRILAEGALFKEIQAKLGNGAGLRDSNAGAIHQSLREHLLGTPAFSWLAQPAAPRIGVLETIGDVARLVAPLLGLGIPGLAIAWAWNGEWPAVVFSIKTWLLFIGSMVLLAGALIVCVLLWGRWLEQRDSSHDAPRLDEAAMRAMARREDFIVQNHMASIVHVKPGVLRCLLVGRGLRVLGYLLRLTARNGYLSSMRTIHFAHWALLSNGSRLMFQSNFDGSWESYLDDFIEKAHRGLTFAWGSCIGFPPTRNLVQEGATNGREFKSWARHSMSESQFWFSAYPRYSVNQIERQARITAALRKPSLSDKEAAAWALDL